MQFNSQKFLLRTAFITTCFLLVSYAIGMMTRSNMGWYDSLEKPSLTPPDITFPIVWSCLYILLSFAASMLWGKRHGDKGHKHLVTFAIYMMLNWAWSFIFFGAHQVFLGFIWILMTLVPLLYLLGSLYKNQQKIEICLIVPTFFWSLFAAYLNGYIYVAG